MTFNDNNQIDLGDNFKAELATKDFPLKNIPLQSKPLGQPTISIDILQKNKPTEVELGDINNLIPTLDPNTLALFFVRNIDNVLRAVLLFQYQKKWRLIARELGNQDNWNKETVIFSTNPLT